MRLFFAVELPAEQHRRIAEGLAALRRRLPPARWVRPEGVHITLKFLGELPAEGVGGLLADAQAALGTAQPVRVVLGGAGFFPSPRRPRVAWLGGQGAGLEEWVAALERCARRYGVAEEGRDFSLHLTLARLDRPWEAEAVEQFQRLVGAWQLGPFVAREVVLFRSELGPGGARYTPQGRLAIAEGRGGSNGA